MSDSNKIVITDINDESLKVLAGLVKDLNMADKHDSLDGALGDEVDARAIEIATALIEENSQLQKVEFAKMVSDGKMEDKSPTPFSDSYRHWAAVRRGDMKTATELQEKINYGTTTTGGYFSQNEPATFFLDLVVNDSNVMSESFTTPMKTNTLTIPTLTDAGRAYTVAEASSANSAALTAVNTTTGLVTLTAYKRGVYQIVTDELLDDSDPAFEGVLRMAMARELSASADWGVFHGNNTAGASRTNDLFSGLEGDNIITSNVINAGGAISFDDILAARAAVQENTMGELVMFVNPAVENQLLGIKDNDGQYIYHPAVREGTVPTIWGHKVIVNRNISKTLGGGSESAVFFGGFRESALFGIKNQVKWVFDPFTYSESTSVKIVASIRIAFEVADESHFALIGGITV